MGPQRGTFGDKNRKDLLRQWLSLHLMGAAGHQNQKSLGKILLETALSYIFTDKLYLMHLHFLLKLSIVERFLAGLTGDLTRTYYGVRP